MDSTAARRMFAATLIALVLVAGLAASVSAVEPPASASSASLSFVPVTEDGRDARPVLRGPVDDEIYIVGPGDGFRITIVGPTIETHSGTVTPEGELVIPGVAAVAVAGETLASVKERLSLRVGERYKDVEVTVSLVDVRLFQVHVLGAVENPGVYIATAMDPVSVIIDLAGGPLPGASRRNIVVTRYGGAEVRADLTRYLNTGDMSANPPVVDGDVIYVPYSTSFVEISGGVHRPGRYELVAGETVGDLVNIAGGFVRGALADSVEVRTFVDGRTARTVFVASGGGGADRVLEDGDQVTVKLNPHWKTPKEVTIQGEVLYPGSYGIDEGKDRLSDVVARAGGFTEDASVALSILVRPEVPVEDDPEFERLQTMTAGEMENTEYAYLKTMYRHVRGRVSLDFAKAMAGDASHDVLLSDGDVIVVPKDDDTVNVIGQVGNPGKIQHAPGKHYRFYIEEAGGFSYGASRGRIRVIKGATGERRRARFAGALEPGDVVWVPEKPETDWLEFLKEIASLASAVATVYLVVTTN